LIRRLGIAFGDVAAGKQDGGTAFGLRFTVATAVEHRVQEEPKPDDHEGHGQDDEDSEAHAESLLMLVGRIA
jgi:hypothetical protein